MLVLTRRGGERLIITTPEGREIEIILTDLRADKARIGITADPDVTIHRSEVQEAIQRGEPSRHQAARGQASGPFTAGQPHVDGRQPGLKSGYRG